MLHCNKFKPDESDTVSADNSGAGARVLVTARQHHSISFLKPKAQLAGMQRKRDRFRYQPFYMTQT
jgi:hypothetical protein